MAIYHLSAGLLSRARGQRAVAAAAYRSGTALRDERYGITHNYTGRGIAEFLQVMAPAGAPAWVLDRQSLWNNVETCELRKDSQLARFIDVGLPIELSSWQCIALLSEFVATEFVASGMVADVCIRRDRIDNPQAHIMLTLRDLLPSGFGPKARRWNSKTNLVEWRCAWAERANEHLARAGQGVRIDHRTLEAQQIELIPSRNIGIGRKRGSDDVLPSHVADRVSDQRRIVKENGDCIVADPSVLLRALTHQSPSFSQSDLARFIYARTSDAAQFEAAYRAVTSSKELVASTSENQQSRFTSRDMLEAGRSLVRRAESMARRPSHNVSPLQRGAALMEVSLSETQRCVFEYLVSAGDVKAVVLEGKVRLLLKAVSRAWSAAGLAVWGAARTGRAAQSLQDTCGAESRSIASYETAWGQGRDLLDANDVLMVDGAEMIGLKQLERVMGVADKARAKIVFIADSSQLLAMRVDAPFTSLLREVGVSLERAH